MIGEADGVGYDRYGPLVRHVIVWVEASTYCDTSKATKATLSSSQKSWQRRVVRGTTSERAVVGVPVDTTSLASDMMAFSRFCRRLLHVYLPTLPLHDCGLILSLTCVVSDVLRCVGHDWP